MRGVRALWLIAIVGCGVVTAQTAQERQSQSPRQALIEMFLGKSADDFTRHLPEEARRTLLHKGETPETSWVLRISEFGRQLVAQGQHIETFDTGSTLLVSEQNGLREKIEVQVERDTLTGEGDEIELSVHYFKNGQQMALPVVPRITFTFAEEKEIWRLTELTAAAHVPLTDPDYLRSLRKQQNESTESSIQGRLGIIAAAETSFVSRHPEKGYSCSLGTLFSQDQSGEPGESESLYDPGQGNDEWHGYRFTLSGCEGMPVSKYRILATPLDIDADMRTFCADQLAAIKSIDGGKSSSCFSRGKETTLGPRNTE